MRALADPLCHGELYVLRQIIIQYEIIDLGDSDLCELPCFHIKPDLRSKDSSARLSQAALAGIDH